MNSSRRLLYGYLGTGIALILLLILSARLPLTLPQIVPTIVVSLLVLWINLAVLIFPLALIVQFLNRKVQEKQKRYETVADDPAELFDDYDDIPQLQKRKR
jgi:hypothetical protein